MTPPSITPSWKRVLREAGLPEPVVIIDFEQFYTAEYSLRNMSSWEYITDARYEELGRSILHIPAGSTSGPIGWSWGDDPAPLLWLQAEYGQDLERCTVVAHNLAYDGLILYHKYGIKIPHAVDTLGLARYDWARAENSLDAVAKRLGFPPKGKTSDFKDMHLRDFFEGAKPNEKGRELEAYANRDAEIEFLALKHYLPRWANVATEARLMRHTLELFWAPRIVADLGAAAEIRPKMEAELAQALTASGHARKEISGNNSFRALMIGAVKAAGDNPERYIKYGKPKPNGTPVPLLAAAQSDDARALMLNHKDPHVRGLIEARVAIKSWPNHIKRIDRIVAMSRAANGLVPIPLKYSGAHSHRWSGTGGVNYQNLGSRGDPLISRVRDILTAPAGHKLVIVDAAAIEARVLAWLAGQWDLCEKFAKGADIYSEFASEIVGRPVQKPRDNDPAPVAKWRKWARNSIGKIGILGLGYQMGAAKAELYAGGAVDFETAERMVQTYRKNNAAIVRYWGDLERRFKAAAKHGEPGTLRHGVRIYRDGPDTCMRLPSGGVMRYHNLKVRPSGNYSDLVIPNPKGTGGPSFTYGGSLAENATQATARDILGGAILETEDAGYQVVHHCHDEIIACVPEAQAQQAYADIVRILSTPPVWAEGLPLDAEGGVFDRYEKP